VSDAGLASGTATRVATAAVLLPGTVAAVWWGPTWVVASLVAVVIAVCLWEFFSLAERQGMRGFRLWVTLCVLGVIASQLSLAGARGISLAGGEWLLQRGKELPLELVLVVFVLGLAVGVVVGRRPLADAFPSLGISAAGLLVLGLPFSYLVRLHGLPDGRLWLLLTLAVVWAGDTAAYFGGRAFGRTAMAPRISPKKTWEGAAANVVGSLMVGALFSQWIVVGLGHLLAMALLANAAGQVGDLVESAYKRGAGVKDSSGLLPGHGGMLDRVDALIFAAPVVWAYAASLH